MHSELTTITPAIRLALLQHADRPALQIGTVTYDYQTLNHLATRIAQTLSALYPQPDVHPAPFIAILGQRSLAVYAGILGTLLAGQAYLPLHPDFPVARLKTMLQIAHSHTLILAPECVTLLKELSADPEIPALTLLCPLMSDEIYQLAQQPSRHRFILDLSTSPAVPALVSPQDTAYLLFTSGSTGTPKGVVVSQGNVGAYLQWALNHYELTPQDRLSSSFDITFDPSVHDLLVSLLSGACLYVIPLADRLAPAKIIREQQLTHWFSVPAVAMMMAQLRLLKPGQFPSLRYSLFAGEALPANTAQAWQQAAPHSIVENLYGPTETTIVVTHYRWNPNTSPAECVNGLVPIGQLNNTQHTARLLDLQGHETPPGQPGELCLSGPQVTAGYFNNPSATADRFITFADTGPTRWYRTGDWVQPLSQGGWAYLERIDHQIQIRGYRVELAEVDHILRQAAGTDLAISVPIASAATPQIFSTLWAVIAGERGMFCESSILAYCQQHLPPYMVPSQVRFIEHLPLNTNGKINRQDLQMRFQA